MFAVHLFGEFHLWRLYKIKPMKLQSCLLICLRSLLGKQVCEPDQTAPIDQGYKTFFMLNLAEHEIYPANVKMSTIVGILTFISMIITTI